MSLRKNIFDSALFKEQNIPIAGLDGGKDKILELDQEEVYNIISEVKDYTYFDKAVVIGYIVNRDITSFKGVYVEVISDGGTCRDIYDMWLGSDGHIKCRLDSESGVPKDHSFDNYDN